MKANVVGLDEAGKSNFPHRRLVFFFSTTNEPFEHIKLFLLVMRFSFFLSLFMRRTEIRSERYRTAHVHTHTPVDRRLFIELCGISRGGVSGVASWDASFMVQLGVINRWPSRNWWRSFFSCFSHFLFAFVWSHCSANENEAIFLSQRPIRSSCPCTH